MFETYNKSRHEVMAITSMQAIKLHKAPTEDGRQSQNGTETQGSAGQSLTMGQAEKVLKSLVEEGWFEKSPKGYYSLSPRALMELRGWLMETYNDVDEDDEEDTGSKKVKQCFACKDIITSVSAHPLLSRSITDCSCRVNGAPKEHALADYTTSAPRTSFGRRDQRTAPCAKLAGQGKTMLENEQQSRRSQKREGRGVESIPEHCRLSMLMKGLLKIKKKKRWAMTVEGYLMQRATQKYANIAHTLPAARPTGLPG